MIHEILKEINESNSSNYKLDVLKKYKDNELLQRVLKMTYDKVAFTYGITMKNIEPKYEVGSGCTLEEALDFMETKLCTRELTGHDALNAMKFHLEFTSKDDAKLLELIIGRDLKINVGASQINKVWKDLITKPIYMRCEHFTQDHIDKKTGNPKKGTARNITFVKPTEDPRAVIQLKADGTYREFSTHGTSVAVVSRSGESYSYPKFENEFANAPEGYFHGEITVRLDDELLAKILPKLEKEDEKKGTENVKEILEAYENSKRENREYILPRSIGNGLVNSDDVPYDNIIYDIWDFITPEDYTLASLKDKKNLPKIKYADRFEMVKQIVKEINHPDIRVIEHKYVRSLKEAMEFVSEKMLAGFEGGVLKSLDMLFKDGTSNEQLKMKLEIQVEVRITGFLPGNKGSKNEAYFSAVTFANDEGTIKGQIGVTSMTEKERDWFHENRELVMMKVMTVECNDLSKARGHDYYALSHPRYIEMRDHEKDETDTLERVLENREMAMTLKD